ncbi:MULTISPECIES: type III pantothenate kinase [unclassified Methylophaga]|jgi:type III pantothenate kinase|uniref:type III pantothenate kinase n=1 Tax=unclassified Methylophaga TaxID=2629249 RepID=UPI000C977F9C|nr:MULTISPECIES: type III pantothenate kinase [unclassified Methylophaga]MAK67158.1 type III pantothenate kinase [Methylophaga sp.]MAY18196.1 type III pantothenate kinase [Methylophaga sp.]HAO24700.1 type III pantothenate kinase [Methylophaga sp.]HCD05151.1 type III pantothenate kinase [Methylophaga sp.]|tara:strand:- start:383 stop:1228 length:846 start_codon:yes stop_codon:yes gene_type:complete
MILLVDIGNSQVKWTTIKSKVLADSESFARPKTGIKAALNKAWKSLDGITAIFVSNVAGEKMAAQLSEWVEKQWQLTPVFIRSEKRRFGVTNAYDQAETLGIDRWLAIIAGRQHAKEVTCIIDCGTAITVDIVTEKGQHQGGLILPGLSLMKQMLTDNTDALNNATQESEFKLLATNTHSAIQAGTLYMVTATLENLINDLQQNFKNEIRFLITGGDADELIRLLPQLLIHEPDLVLKGLAQYARQTNQRNQNKPSKQSETKSSADENHVEDSTALPENTN